MTEDKTDFSEGVTSSKTYEEKNKEKEFSEQNACESGETSAQNANKFDFKYVSLYILRSMLSLLKTPLNTTKAVYKKQCKFISSMILGALILLSTISLSSVLYKLESSISMFIEPNFFSIFFKSLFTCVIIVVAVTALILLAMRIFKIDFNFKQAIHMNAAASLPLVWIWLLNIVLDNILQISTWSLFFSKTYFVIYVPLFIFSLLAVYILMRDVVCDEEKSVKAFLTWVFLGQIALGIGVAIAVDAAATSLMRLF